ncbi:MAG: YggT family protein [Bacilli bacterium]|nr:YggT family protein [Bacilli bacterium]
MDEAFYYILYYSYYILQVYFYVIIATIILSWTPLRTSGFYQLLDRVTSPYLNVFRGWLVIGMIDLTPMIGLFLYQFILTMIGRAL